MVLGLAGGGIGGPDDGWVSCGSYSDTEGGVIKNEQVVEHSGDRANSQL